MKKVLLLGLILLSVIKISDVNVVFSQVREEGAVISISPNPPQRGQATTFSAARCPANTIAIFQWENTSSGATDRSTPQRVGPDGRVSYVHAPDFRNAPYVAWVNCGSVLSQRITFTGPVANPDPVTDPGSSDPGSSDPGGSNPDPATSDPVAIDPEPQSSGSTDRDPTPIPPFPPCAERTDDQCTSVNSGIGLLKTDPQNFILTLFRILMSISGGIALILIITSGYQIMTSQGDPEKIKAGRERFISAVVGLLFLIFSLVILETIGVDILRIPGFGS